MLTLLADLRYAFWVTSGTMFAVASSRAGAAWRQHRDLSIVTGPAGPLPFEGRKPGLSFADPGADASNIAGKLMLATRPRRSSDGDICIVAYREVALTRRAWLTVSATS